MGVVAIFVSNPDSINEPQIIFAIIFIKINKHSPILSDPNASMRPHRNYIRERNKKSKRNLPKKGNNFILNNLKNGKIW